MEKLRVLTPLLIGIAVAFGIFIGSRLNFGDSTEKIFSVNSKKDKLNRLIDYIDFEYVDKINTDSIVDVTVNGILSNLDPHSVYIPIKNYESVAEDMRGKFVGIGVSFYIYNDTVSVIYASQGGPAQRAGITGGDRILYADGIPLFGKDIQRDSITSVLKGEINTRVNLQILRPGQKQLLEVAVVRNEIPIKSVDAAYMLDANTGYIKINRFAESTEEEFDDALKYLLKQSATSVVLDFRDNPGGYVHVAEHIANQFLSKGKLIMMTKNKSGVIKNTFAKKKALFEKGNVYILVNEMSASASEIVAGAIQDNDRGVIIGRRTYGKGLVQREMSLGDGSAVRLTVARYYTPTGRSIQRPYDSGEREYFNEYQKRYENGELVDEQQIKIEDSLRFVTPGGKVVYGGGGIIPDYFIPKDFTDESEALTYIIRSGHLSYFVFEYLERNRAAYQTMTPETFFNEFEVTEEILNEFAVYSDLRQNSSDVKKLQEKLKKYIKATLAQQLFGEDYYEKIVNADDQMILKALELEEEFRAAN